MDVIIDDLHNAIETALGAASNSFGDEIIAHLNAILQNNIKNGRFATFAAGTAGNLQEYLQRVVNCYLQNHLYIRKVQVEKDDLVWNPLYSKISTWVFNFFLHKGFDSEYTRAEIVHDVAQEAAIQILQAKFTYDTEFDPWAYMIVRDVCLKYMRNAMKKSAIPSSAILELDDGNDDHIADPRHPQEAAFKENRAALLTAIDRLPPERREVIIQKYFYELSSEKIAENTHKSVAAIYSMHFNAIENLRKILSD